MQLGVALNFKDLCVRSENQLREAILRSNGTKVEYQEAPLDNDELDEVEENEEDEICPDILIKVLLRNN